jgi:hypothetical protein
MSTGTIDTGNTGNSTTSTPGFSRGLFTSLGGDGIGLTLVLGHVGVDMVHNVRTDRSLEHSRERHSGIAGLARVGVDINNLTSSLIIITRTKKGSSLIIHSPIHPFIHSSIHPSIHLSTHPFIRSSILPCFLYLPFGIGVDNVSEK